jgi:hypothetical protein
MDQAPQRIVALVRDILADGVIGPYVHGSAASDCGHA